MHGKARCSALSRSSPKKPACRLGSDTPPVGKIPSVNEKAVRSNMPTQKSGIDQVTIDDDVSDVSFQVPRRQAATMPTTTPRTVARRVESPTSQRVAGAAS